ncbi:MAG: ABC transporter permease [Sphingomicrobium sp.]
MRPPKMIRSAFVIARRDFTATVMSKTFLLFLLGPLFPLAVGIGFGGLGDTIRNSDQQPVVAVVASSADYRAIEAARKVMEPLLLEDRGIMLSQVAPSGDLAAQRKALLAQEKPPVLGVLDGGLEAPHFTGAVNADGLTVRQLSFIIDQARRARAAPTPPSGTPLAVELTQSSSGSLMSARSVTARLGQALLFVLTILLAGMLLSQLIEEKSNKAIEVIAAAIPIESIFIGKLFAMLGMAWVGILVWTAGGAAAIAFYLPGGLSALPAPAVGWPVFIALGVIYFSMSYLLIGSLFLGIGSQASTVREVQTLSMPVTMAQMMIFALATVGVGHPESASAIAGAVFPLSSPFAMFGRAAELPLLLPHVAALAWQIMWVIIILRLSARLFRRSVLKSGPAFRWPWQKKAAV